MLVRLQDRLLRERSESLHSAAQPLEPHSLDDADSATDEFDHNLALARLSAKQDALYEVTEALERITDGGYGVCQQSGKRIPAARLRAVPWTRFTREAEEQLEEQGTIRRPHLGPTRTVRKRGRVWLAPEGEPEELEEHPPAPPNDEALSKVPTPLVRRSVRKRTSPSRRNAVSGKGR